MSQYFYFHQSTVLHKYVYFYLSFKPFTYCPGPTQDEAWKEVSWYHFVSQEQRSEAECKVSC